MKQVLGPERSKTTRPTAGDHWVPAMSAQIADSRHHTQYRRVSALVQRGLDRPEF